MEAHNIESQSFIAITKIHKCAFMQIYRATTKPGLRTGLDFGPENGPKYGLTQ